MQPDPYPNPPPSLDNFSPPRVRHTKGPSRFEKEVIAHGEPAGFKGGEGSSGLDIKQVGEWRLGKYIGKGSSGQVRIARSVRDSSLYAAVKVIPSPPVSRSESGTEAREKAEKARNTLEREIVIMKLIDHPNVMGLIDVHEIDGLIYLVLEYVPGGELFDLLVSQRHFIADEASKYFQQIIRGLQYCHLFGICHRDLKPENLLLDENKNIKIADFGMAAWQGMDQLLETSCGSPHYAAPEIVSGKTYHGSATDIWSCGVILYALLIGSLPFDDQSMTKLLNKVRFGQYYMPPHLPEDAKDLIRRMLVVNPKDRITMEDIVAHPFLMRRLSTAKSETKPLVEAPKLEELARPVKAESEIDPEILQNLCALWRGNPKEVIVEALMTEGERWEKAFYCLLERHKNRKLENFGEAPEDAYVAAQEAKRLRRQKSDASQRHARKRTRSSNDNTVGAIMEERMMPQSSDKNTGHRGHARKHSHRDAPLPPNQSPGTVSPSTPRTRQQRQLRGPRSPSTHASPIVEQVTASVLMREHPMQLDPPAEIQRPIEAGIRGSPMPHRGNGPAGYDVSPEEMNYMDAVTGRSPAQQMNHSDMEVVEEFRNVQIGSQGVQEEQQPIGLGFGDQAPQTAAIISADPAVLDVMRSLNPEGHPELDAFLRDTAAQVTAFRQYGVPLTPRMVAPSPRPTSIMSGQDGRRRSLFSPMQEQFFTPPINTPPATGTSDGFGIGVGQPANGANLWDRPMLPPKTRNHMRSRTDRPLDEREMVHRREIMGESTGANKVNLQEKRRAKSVIDKPLPFGGQTVRRQKTLLTVNTATANTPQMRSGAVEFIAQPSPRPMSPFLGGVEGDNKTSLLKALFSPWMPFKRTLMSGHDVGSVIVATSKILLKVNIAVETEDTEHIPHFRCKVDTIRDNQTGVAYEKPLRFRIDFRKYESQASLPGQSPIFPVSGLPLGQGTIITFMQEKGSNQTLAAVIDRFRAEWVLDDWLA